MINPKEAIKIAENNPYKGTAKQIAKLSISIAQSAQIFDHSVFALYKEKINISPKIFSKLKVIGETLLDIKQQERNQLINQFPDSYTTIHILCSISNKDLVTAAEKGDITANTTAKEAQLYVQQIRFPTGDGEKGKWGYKQEHLFNIVRPDDVPMSTTSLNNLKSDIRKICLEYGAELQVPNPSGTTPLRQQERKEKALFWKSILNKEIDQKWFDKTPKSTRKKFNIQSLDDLHESDITTFTSFIIKVEGSKDIFWNTYGKAYICKLQILSEEHPETGQRYNYRKRLKSYLQDKNELRIWNDLVLEENGFTK